MDVSTGTGQQTTPYENDSTVRCIMVCHRLIYRLVTTGVGLPMLPWCKDTCSLSLSRRTVRLTRSALTYSKTIVSRWVVRKSLIRDNARGRGISYALEFIKSCFLFRTSELVLWQPRKPVELCITKTILQHEQIHRNASRQLTVVQILGKMARKTTIGIQHNDWTV